MTSSHFPEFEEKMNQAGISEAAIRAFERNYNALIANENGLIAEDRISPADNLPSWEVLSGQYQSADQSLLDQTVVIKLNGGLGTSMGLQKAKSLLKVKGEDTFLDIIVRQILALRKSSSRHVRLLFMDSFSTSEDTLAYLSRYAEHGLAAPGDVELMQNRIPKIDANTYSPASCPSSPDLEWCPPGHGDLYPALLGSGWLDKLLAAGIKYAFVSNSDNLGATLDPALLAWFAGTGAPFAMEVTRRTGADKKGGHLATRKEDNRLILREIAQCPEEDLDEFQNIDKHRYFNTNNLWIRLDALSKVLTENGGVLPLPMIKNKKTLDPRNSESTPVFQLETAMGAGIECFSGAIALDVPRDRFAPVKTTADLFALRSDAYVLTPDGHVQLAPERHNKPPLITLDGKLHKLVDSLDALGTPSLRDVDVLTIEGDVRFAPSARLSGTCEFINPDNTRPLVIS